MHDPSFVFDNGTTSACAENTLGEATRSPLTRNYLRVRGEYFAGRIVTRKDVELPPRARRILGPYTGAGKINGTTSACAENTLNELGLL